MCCEATDALLEYVRRYLGLTGLRNLNAPRRLKLRVPVLKEWLQRQGQHALASSIPDWDPVRRPTGRWKAWEMAHLKPIMDEKAVERQAKRNLVSGEATQMARAQEMNESTNRQEAIDALMAVGHSEMSAANAPSAEPVLMVEHVRSDNQDDFQEMVEDDGGEGAEEVDGAEESQPGDENIMTATEALETACSRVASIRALLLRFDPQTDMQNAMFYDCVQQVNQLESVLSKQLGEGPSKLVSCRFGPPRPASGLSDAAGPGGMGVGHPTGPVKMWPGGDTKPQLKSGEGERPEHISSQEEAALLLNASQVSMSDSVVHGLIAHEDDLGCSQPERLSQESQEGADGTSDSSDHEPQSAKRRKTMATTGATGGTITPAKDEAATAAKVELPPMATGGMASAAGAMSMLAAGQSPNGGIFRSSQEQDQALTAILANAP